MNAIRKTITDNQSVVGVPIQSLLKREKIPFNIYIKINEAKYILVSAANSPRSKQDLAKYIDRGVSYVFISHNDKIVLLGNNTAILESISNLSEVLNEPSLDLKEKVSILISDAGSFLKQLHENKMDKMHPEIIKASLEITNKLIEVVSQDYNVIESFLELTKVHNYHWNHAIGCSAFMGAFMKYLRYDPYLKQQTTPTHIRDACLAALLHDIGKRKININILHKETTLNLAEWVEMKKHPIYSLEMVKNIIKDNDFIQKIVLHHHENWDGSGYPLSLKGSDIHVVSRMLAIVDNFTSMISTRSYASAFSVEKALETMFSEEHKFDAYLLDKFFMMFREKLTFEKI